MRLYEFVMAEDGYLLGGPLALTATSDFLGDLGGGGGSTTDVDLGPVDTPTYDDAPAPDTLPDDAPAPEGDEPPPGDQPDDPDARPDKVEAAAETDKSKEVLPAALSKAIRELKAAHPDQAPALKALNDAFYTARAYKQVYDSPDAARIDKAAIEAIGGHEGIAGMRREISSIRDFDEMAESGDPNVIKGLAEQFPDGFKRLVPAAIDQLSRLDPQAFAETMRAPLLRMLEGDGIINAIADSIEYLKAANTEPDAAHIHRRSAEYRLNQLATWYKGLKDEDTAYKSRYQDPRMQEVERRERAATQREQGTVRENVIRDLGGYLRETMKPGISTALTGRSIDQEGRQLFERLVEQEVQQTVSANPNYVASMKDFVKEGKVERAIAYAKPFIDVARRAAISKISTQLYGKAPVAPARPTSRPAANGNGTSLSAAPTRIQPIAAKPHHDQIDWSKTTNLMFVGNRAVLTNGKMVTWR